MIGLSTFVISLYIEEVIKVFFCSKNVLEVAYIKVFKLYSELDRGAV